jgi:cyclophilin family peptidyl-prolyl cis-trans isomerase
MCHCRAAVLSTGIFLFLTFLTVASHAGILAQFRTVYGDMDVELFDKDKPITVANFIRYVQAGKYKDLFFNRLEPGFVIQAGGWYVADRGTANASITDVVRFPPIKNEYGAGNIYSNAYGTIAMAKVAGDTNSASSEWYFNLANNLFLDAHDSNHYFTVFGRVLKGTNILNILNTFQYDDGTQVTNLVMNRSDWDPAFAELPLREPYVAENTILYVDISLLNVQIKRTNNVQEISWNSVAGKTNRVEYTTTLPSSVPPTWNLLIATNGNGGTISVRDLSGDSRRFYRVRVNY